MAMGMYFPPAEKPAEPEISYPRIPQRWCLACATKSMIPLCWYRFGRNHIGCDVWACYCCNARTYKGFTYRADESFIHTECGYGGRVG